MSHKWIKMHSKMGQKSVKNGQKVGLGGKKWAGLGENGSNVSEKSQKSEILGKIKVQKVILARVTTCHQLRKGFSSHLANGKRISVAEKFGTGKKSHKSKIIT